MAKIELTDFVRYGELFETYGKLLSEDRQVIMKQYFDYNMTLAEISDEKKISRQAVLDSITKSCEKLEEYEKVLNILKIKNKLKEMKNTKTLEETKRKVDEILGDM